jgi:hypothetical protein
MPQCAQEGLREVEPRRLRIRLDAAVAFGTVSDMGYVDKRIKIRRKSTFGEKQPITLESFLAGLGTDIQSHWAGRNRAGRNPTVALYPDGDLL